MPIRLRPHQESALKSMQLSHHGQIIVPTGGGKTFIMIQHAKELLKGQFKTVVVVAPRILLANQLSNDFLEHIDNCLLYTSPSPRDKRQSRMPSSA